jgi:hypothetical protein
VSDDPVISLIGVHRLLVLPFGGAVGWTQWPVAPFAICRGRKTGLVPDRLREVDYWTDRGVGPVDDVLQCRRGKPGYLF